MNDYKELIEELREEKLYPIYTILEGKASDVIEQLVQEYNELDKVHDEMFLELCKVKKERDEAISQICQGCDNCKHRDTTIGEPCISCSTYRVDSDFIHSKWEWRGVTDD